jgi:hypothetical protein
MGDQTDFWPDGIYDCQATQRREFWRDGELKRYADRICCGIQHPHFTELRHPWGHFKDLPNSMDRAA